MRHYPSTIAAALILFGSQAFAGIDFQYRTPVTAEFEVQSSEHFISAAVLLDGARGTIALSLQPKMPPCPEGQFCVQVMPPELSYNLPIVHAAADDCRILRTQAMIDNLASDGSKLTVTLIDNRYNICPTFIALEPTEMIFEEEYHDRIHGTFVSELSVFKGTGLRAVASEAPVAQ